MSEKTYRPDQDSFITQDVRDYLRFASTALKKNGAKLFLNSASKRHIAICSDLVECAQQDGDKQDAKGSYYQIVVDEAFNAARLPLAVSVIHPDDEADETHYSLVKVDKRGHAYLGYSVDVCVLNPDGSRSPLDYQEASEDLIKTMQKLATRQAILGWQPVIDPDDEPVEIMDLPGFAE